jgi:hypothetical protein
MWLHKNTGDSLAGGARWLHKTFTAGQDWLHKTSAAVDSVRDRYAQAKQQGLSYLSKRYGSEVGAAARAGVNYLESRVTGNAVTGTQNTFAPPRMKSE